MGKTVRKNAASGNKFQGSGWAAQHFIPLPILVTMVWFQQTAQTRLTHLRKGGKVDAVNQTVPGFTADRILKGLCSVSLTVQVTSGVEQCAEISRVFP